MRVIGLSDNAEATLSAEREVIVDRLESLREQRSRVHALVEALDADLEEAARLLGQIDELLGIAPQLSIDACTEELRGRALSDVALTILRQRRGPDAEIHYRDWFQLVRESGVRIAGKDPLGLFLTAVTRTPEVESVRPRSGLFRLVA